MLAFACWHPGAFPAARGTAASQSKTDKMPWAVGPCVLRYRRGSALRSGFGEAAERIRQENRAKEEAEKAERKKKEAAKIQAQVKKRMEAREKAEAARKKKAEEQEAQQREAAAARRAAAAAKRQAKAEALADEDEDQAWTPSNSEDDGEDEDEDEDSPSEKLPLSDAANELLQTVKLWQQEGKTLKLFKLMDNVTSLEPAHDRTEVGSAVVKALLQSARAVLAFQAVQQAEECGYPLASKLIVSVVKGIAVRRPQDAASSSKAGRSGRAKGKSARGMKKTEGADEEVRDDVDMCLELAELLRKRGEALELSAIAQVYAVVVCVHLRHGRLGAAKESLSLLRAMPVAVKLGVYKSMMREFALVQSLQGLLQVLDLMGHFGVEADAEVLEMVANVCVHDVTFVKGAVSMETLPSGGLPEACLAGRSNVGKSSLVNMVCNRKKLAFTSKTPGKTQEFNYFLVTGGQVVGAQAESSSAAAPPDAHSACKNRFHLVDLPGVGYAEVPSFKREEWKKFYRAYLTERAELRVLFQLIDGRHGALKDDVELMQLLTVVQRERSAPPFQHVVVLTKMDKRESKDVERVLGSVREALEGAGCDAELTPIVLTSSLSKLGRAQVWRYLRLAADMGQEPQVVNLASFRSSRKGGNAAAPPGRGKKSYSNKSVKFKGLGKALRKLGT